LLCTRCYVLQPERPGSYIHACSVSFRFYPYTILLTATYPYLTQSSWFYLQSSIPTSKDYYITGNWLLSALILIIWILFIFLSYHRCSTG
jgi:hypothetical protein